MKAKNREILCQLLLYINFLAIILLLLAYSATIINPKFFSFPQLFGLAYPIILLINVVFILLWLYFRRHYFIFSLIAIFVGIGFIGRTIRFNNFRRITPSSFSVMTYNVRVFNYYKWNGNKYTDKAIFELIKQNPPDLLCLQEFISNKKVQALEEFTRIYPYYVITNQKGQISFGQVIFSKYPILKSYKLKHGNIKYGIVADVNIQGKRLRIINVHLRSVALANKEYSAINSLKFDKRRLRRLLNKLTSGYRLRQQEVKQLTSMLDTSTLPVILCGDFNETPISYTYTQIALRLNDAFVSAGRGIGNTYVYYLPFFRIDYVFYSDDLKVLSYSKLKIKLSDHFPLRVEFGF